VIDEPINGGPNVGLPNVGLPNAGPPNTGPLGAFRRKQMSKPANGTGATTVRRATKIAVIHPTDRPRAVSIQSRF
jgi:hypothetical protein